MVSPLSLHLIDRLTPVNLRPRCAPSPSNSFFMHIMVLIFCELNLYLFDTDVSLVYFNATVCVVLCSCLYTYVVLCIILRVTYTVLCIFLCSSLHIFVQLFVYLYSVLCILLSSCLYIFMWFSSARNLDFILN